MARALVFPGQGAQYVGMGAELAQRYPVAREVLDEADAVLGLCLSDIIFNGPEEELTRTDISQPAILTISWMAYQVMQRSAPQTSFAATGGLSLGEYTALVAARSLSFAAALRLVRLRGQAMQAAAEATPGGMLVLIGADEASATALCLAAAEGEVLSVANLNCPGQVVISGAAAACGRAAELAREHGIRRAIALPVAGAFHSRLMAPAAARLALALAETEFAEPVVSVYSNRSAEPIPSAAAIPQLLIEQLVSPVRWADSIVAMHRAGIDEFLELGPGKTLIGMISRTLTEVSCANLDNPADAVALASR